MNNVYLRVASCKIVSPVNRTIFDHLKIYKANKGLGNGVAAQFTIKHDNKFTDCCFMTLRSDLNKLSASG